MLTYECHHCAHRCRIPEGGYGRCGMYRGAGGAAVEVFPDSYLARYPTAIETVPFLHFWPGHTFYAVSSVGCNLSCPGCVSAILTTDPGTLTGALVRLPPDEVVSEAEAAGCRGILFCINEPAVSLPTVLRLADAAHDAGLLFGCSTNGYLGGEATREGQARMDKSPCDDRCREQLGSGLEITDESAQDDQIFAPLLD